ncbi:hypothetical protein [Streptomyces venezuelae]|uniref:hypothetical protein n=1 Tax=Streptomyces venezuelae TaxID=54571 RepID=UPI003440DD91
MARAADAHLVVDCRAQDATAEILASAREGVDIVVEVSPAANTALAVAVAAPGAAVAYNPGAACGA